MALREITFFPEAALQSILYILQSLGGKATVHQILKVRYFADKLHLAEFGWIASGDRYCAMQFGPVASRTYDLLKAARPEVSSEHVPPKFRELAQAALDASLYPALVARRAADESQMSAADRNSLNAAIDQCKGWGFAKRTNESHDQAWKEARERWQKNGDMDMPVDSIAGTLANAEEVIQHLAS